MNSTRTQSSTANVSDRLADERSAHHPRLGRVHYGANPAHGQNPIYAIGGVFDGDYGYGGRTSRSEVDELPHELHHGADPLPPWPQEVYERHQLEQLDASIGLRASAEAGDQLAAQVRERLNGHEGIDAASIVVVVDHGVVILCGEIEDEASRRLAADLVEPMWGVGAVDNRLRVHH